VAIDAKLINGQWRVVKHGGRTLTPLLAVEWAKKAAILGAGEILLTSMNNDGTQDGFALGITKKVAQAVNIPVIASGGAGDQEHFADVFKFTPASAALAASVFHFEKIKIPQLKKYLKTQNIPVRCN
jgi:cyclase